MITYIPLILTALGLIVSVAHNFYYKNKKEKEIQALQQDYDSKKSLMEKRFTVYKEYLNKMDIINSKLYSAQRGDDVLEQINNLFEETSIDPYSERRTQLFAKFVQDRFKELQIWKNEIDKLNDEINVIKLTSSLKVYNLLEEYLELAEEQLGNQIMLAMGPMVWDEETVKSIKENSNMRETLQKIKRELDMAMREDIGNI